MRSLAASLVIGLCLAPAAAMAGNDDTYFMGTTASLTGGAAVARSMDPAAVWYNPAGLGAVKRNQLDLLMSVGALQLRAINSGLLVQYDDIDRSVDLDGSQVTVVSPSTVFVYRLGDLTLGAGLFVTGDEAIRTSGSTTWQSATEAQTLDAEIDSVRTRYHAGLATGFELSEQVRLGFGMFAVYESLVQNFDFGIGWEQPDLIYSEQLDGHDDAARYGLQASAGIQVDLLSGLTVGLLLRSPTVLFHESGTGRLLSTTAVTGGLAGEPSNELGFDEDARARASTGWLEPARAVLGFAYDLGRVQLSAEAEFAHALRALPVRSGFNDGDTDNLVEREALINARAGTLVRLQDGFYFGAGFFTDRSPRRDDPELAEFDVDYYGMTAGFRYDREVFLDGREPADSIIFRSSFGVRYALGTGNTGQFIVDLRDPLNADSRLGNVDVRFHEIHVQLGSGVHF